MGENFIVTISMHFLMVQISGRDSTESTFNDLKMVWVRTTFYQVIIKNDIVFNYSNIQMGFVMVCKHR